MSFDSKESSTAGGAPFELFKFTMGTRAWCFTSGEEERTYMTQIYVPETIDRSEISHNQETSSGSIEVTLPLESSLAAEFISFAPPEPMWLTIYAGHDDDSEIIRRYYGKVAQAKFGDVCTLTVQPQTVAVKKKIPGMVYQQNCNRMHYSAACGASEIAPGGIANEWSVKVGSISGLRITIDAGAAENAAFVAYWQPIDVTNDTVIPTLSWGKAEDSDGRRMMIARHVSWNTFDLMAPLVGMAVGDIIVVTRGCRRTLKHCAFYGRTASFMGFDIMPASNPFQGVS